MEKYNINLGFHYMKSRLQKFYLNREYKIENPFKVKKQMKIVIKKD
ncbi:hypothetical protein AB8B22_07285 [Leptotrichia sp. HSP-334]|uniref:Uncharacterized protein n=1 Tax=Leptotrichia rugosa TaxID=3239302 RepID=A0AB39VG24_9FUSO